MAKTTDNPNSTRTTPVDRYTLFQILLPRIYELNEDLVTKLLFCNNADLADACEGVLYANIALDIDIPGCIGVEDQGERERNRGKADCLLKYPRLGQHLRQLSSRHPPPSTCQVSPTVDETTRETERLQAWTLASNLLSICPNLRSFHWALCFGIGGDMWQGISKARNLTFLDLGQPDLQQFGNLKSASLPRINPELEFLVLNGQVDAAGPVSGKGGWSLGPGWENLNTLALAGLGQNGAKTLATHLQLLCSRAAPTIAMLDISTHFLDSILLSAISDYGQLGSLKHLTLSTSGTRMTADGIQQVLEGCQALESFTLRDSEGRLDKHTWAQIDTWPTTLSTFEIEIDENASHHSWVLHHLASINHLPFAQLKTFAVRRVIHPIALLPFPPINVAIPTVQKGHELRAMPQSLLDAVMEGEAGLKMRSLCLDWWEMGPNELDSLVKACAGLRKLQVAISFPLVKLVTMMQTTFAASTDLEEMILTSQPQYNLEFAPTKSKPDHTVPGMHPYLVSKLHEPDPSIPETKDLRKFVRRLPKLHSLKWTGRGGKGEWSFAKKTTLVSVSFKHSAVLSLNQWAICQLPPPFVEYAETVATKPTVLEMPPTPTLISSPIADFPSLSRSTSASASSIRQPVTPGSPTHSKSLSIKEVNNRLHGLGITPDEEDEIEIKSSSASAPKRHQRRETTDGSVISVAASSASASAGKGRQASLDMAKSTKRLVIGTESSSVTPTSPTLPMLKTTSAPARTPGRNGNADASRASHPSSASGSGAGRGKEVKGSKAPRGKKIEGPRHSK